MNQLSLVTLTGADETVNPKDLADISAKYPYVEWGILFSQKKSSVPRYPSLAWVQELVKVTKTQKIMLSAHCCGKWVDQAIKGKFTLFDDLSLSFREYVDFDISSFSRVQFNLGASRLKHLFSKPSNFYKTVQDIGDRRIILGGNYRDVALDADALLNNCISALFDGSGGNGVLPSKWPQSFVGSYGRQVLCGYAGGLGPDNVLEELPKIHLAAGNNNYWIDMESKIRTVDGDRDCFDLEKCVKVLELVKEWMR